ncbi:MAG: AAA family ATPase [Pseudomonas sp.]
MQRRTPQQPGWMVELTAAVDIPVEKIQWIWPGWLPRAKLSILAGAGGCGKTTLAISLAATLSRGGDWPDGSKGETAGNVVIWSGEDGIADTIIPRLTAADADLNRVHVIEGLRDQAGSRRQFDPANNFSLLNEAVARIDGVSLLIFDPLINLIRGDMHRANEVRQGLQMVVDFAERHCCAVLGISHLSKGASQSSTADRVIGSQAFSALARTVLVAGKAQNSEARVLVRAKSNVSIDIGGIEYFVEPIVIDERLETTCIRWGGAVEGSAETILADIERTGGARPASATQEACSFLEATLQAGPVAITALQSLAEETCISWASVRRAQKQLGIRSCKMGMQGGWVWELPTSP